jgi:hypothetical protein
MLYVFNENENMVALDFCAIDIVFGMAELGASVSACFSPFSPLTKVPGINHGLESC